MKTRITLVILGLVILPTAILSLIAGRTLRSWELVLRRGLETTAANSVESVADRMQANLGHDLKRVTMAMAEGLVNGGENERLEAASRRLRQSGGLVGQIYLFVNPVGLVFPRPPPTAARPKGWESLAAALKREIAAAGPSADTIRFTAGDASYFFSPIRERRDVYVGYEVDPGKFASQLSTIIAEVSGGGFLLVAEGPGVKVGAPRQPLPAEIVVKDTLGQATAVEPSQADGLEAGPLAMGRLYRPFDFVKVSAFVRDPEALVRAEEVRVRLYGWGILLMGGVIIAGVWLVLRDAAAELRRAKTRSDFVIGVSHDLRTPLASMRMLADSLYLGRVPDPEKQKQFLGTIVRESQRLSHLIERVLFFVRFGQDALVFQPRDMDVGLLVAREVEQFRSSVSHVASSAGTGSARPSDAVSLAVQPGLPRVMADDGALVQVVLNLLDNAWKYGKGENRRDGARLPHSSLQASSVEPQCGSRTPCDDPSEQAAITVKVDSVLMAKQDRFWGRKRTWVRVSVTDYGEGIRRSDLRKVFRRFYRARGAGDKNTSGVGLGLALCKHVATAHGGWMEARSRVGQGSTFSLYVPVGK